MEAKVLGFCESGGHCGMGVSSFKSLLGHTLS